MSAVIVLDSKIPAKLVEHGFQYVLPTMNLLASRANADGEVTIPLVVIAEKIGRSPSTVERHINILERLGLVQRVAGGYRGMTVVYVIKRFLDDVTAFIAHRARRAAYAARRKRWNELTAFKRARQLASEMGLRKVRMDANPLTSLRGEQAALGAAPLLKHSFRQGDLLGICSECEFPEANARHRGVKSPQKAWTNARRA